MSILSLPHVCVLQLPCWCGGILELKRRYFDDYCSDNQYIVSIKEDTAYLCLHSPKTTKETRSIRRIQRRPISRIGDIVCEYSGRYQTWSLLQETPIRLIMEYLVNISKRRAFWSLNEDILKITILKTNTPYPSRKIRRIRACTHQRPQRNEAQYDVSRETQYAVFKIYNDINIELSKEFLVELRKNIYHGTYNEDVVDHIAKVLKMVDLIYVPGVDSHQYDENLSLSRWPMMLKNGGLVREMEKSPLGRNLLRNSSVDSIPNHTMEKMKCWMKERTRGLIHLNSYQTESLTIMKNQSNTATDSFFKAYEVRDIEKQCQTKRKYVNTSNSINEQPNKRRCKAEKFEAIQYSLGPNEDYITIRSYEYDIWERNEYNMSKIYQDIFKKGQRMEGDAHRIKKRS
ncbi:hypothetical protein Tco_0236844 [Tanacetum coccineum]